jgi:hypothetical protein
LEEADIDPTNYGKGYIETTDMQLKLLVINDPVT